MKRYEISLWDNCSNGCTFCWTFRSPKANKVDNLKRIAAVEKAKEIIKDITPDDDVLITGGEIFDTKTEDEELNIELAQLLEQLVLCVIFKRIRHLFIITNFLNSNQKLLDYFYKLLTPLSKEQINRVHITTSYDVIGRFHSEESKNEFFQHLSQFAQVLPQNNLVVNTIMT